MSFGFIGRSLGVGKEQPGNSSACELIPSGVLSLSVVPEKWASSPVRTDTWHPTAGEEQDGFALLPQVRKRVL